MHGANPQRYVFNQHQANQLQLNAELNHKSDDEKAFIQRQSQALLAAEAAGQTKHKIGTDHV